MRRAPAAAVWRRSSGEASTIERGLLLGRRFAEAADHQRAAAAAVARFGGVADAPIAVGAGNAAGRARTQQGEFQQGGHGRGIRLNRSKNAASVRCSASSTDQPRTLARAARTCGMKAGSLRRPRIGTGAR